MAAPEYTAANVESAVLQFYYQGASQEIHQWLTNAQMSQAAWNFSWELLMTEKKPEVQFFGASTIAIKVSKFWPEVPEDQVHHSIIILQKVTSYEMKITVLLTMSPSRAEGFSALLVAFYFSSKIGKLCFCSLISLVFSENFYFQF